MRYKITCHCTRCGHKWARTTKDPDSPDPPCPNLACGETPVTIGMDLTSNKAPAAIGGNISIKAIDETAKIVMQDYGMTDLRTDVREGESAAPPLHPRQQKMADSFFGGGGGRERMPGINTAGAVRAAMSGRLSDSGATARSIGAAHANRLRPPTHDLPDPGA